MENKTAAQVTQNIIIKNRSDVSLNGIKEIVSFDESSVNLRTEQGDLLIEGNGIHVDVLNIEKGELQMRGKINALSYYDATDAEKHSLLSRIFG